MHGEGFLQVFYYFEADYNPIITGRFLIANKKPANPAIDDEETLPQ